MSVLLYCCNVLSWCYRAAVLYLYCTILHRTVVCHMTTAWWMYHPLLSAVCVGSSPSMIIHFFWLVYAAAEISYFTCEHR